MEKEPKKLEGKEGYWKGERERREKRRKGKEGNKENEQNGNRDIR